MIRAVLSVVYGAATQVARLLLPWIKRMDVTERLERLGYWDVSTDFLRRIKQDGWIWVHGASLGEIQGLLPLVKKIQEHSRCGIVMTATSRTGVKRARELGFEAHFFPFDVLAAWRQVEASMLTLPKLIVFGETELWVQWVRHFGSRVPMVLANGRISAKSMRWYRWLRPLLGELFANLKQTCVSSHLAADRFLALGALPEKLQVTGNAKFDARPFFASEVSAAERRRMVEESFAEVRPVVVFGSVRPGEELVIVPAIKQLVQSQRWNVVFVPRHLEKTPLFEDSLQAAEISYAKSSVGGQKQSVLLVDAMGQLGKWYALADCAFVGATLVPNLGGHNILEPLVAGTPVICGMHGEVVEEVREELRAANGLTVVTTSDELVAAVESLVRGTEHHRQVLERATVVLQRYQGATERLWQQIRVEL